MRAQFDPPEALSAFVGREGPAPRIPWRKADERAFARVFPV